MTEAIDHTIQFFCARDRPILSANLIATYTSEIRKTGIQHVMSMDISPRSSRLHFVRARNDAGLNLGALGIYVCSRDGGPVERQFCALDASAASTFNNNTRQGLAFLCLGWVAPAHRHAGLYRQIIRVAIALLPFLGVRVITAVGSTKGMRYYREFGVVVDPTVGEHGLVNYPSGFRSHVGWAEIVALSEADHKERSAILNLRQGLGRSSSAYYRRLTSRHDST